MSPHALLSCFASRGILLEATDAGKVRYTCPQGELTDADREAIAANREGILRALRDADAEVATALSLVGHLRAAVKGPDSAFRVLDHYVAVVRSLRERLDVGLWDAVASVRGLANRWGVQVDPAVYSSRCPDVDQEAAELISRQTNLTFWINDGLPVGIPQTVCGVVLSALDAGDFAQAVAAGELVLHPYTPVSSPVPLAWKLWCQEQGRPCVIREASSGVEMEHAA